MFIHQAHCKALSESDQNAYDQLSGIDFSNTALMPRITEHYDAIRLYDKYIRPLQHETDRSLHAIVLNAHDNVSILEAAMLVLRWYVTQMKHSSLNDERAARRFLLALTNQEAFRILLSLVWEHSPKPTK